MFENGKASQQIVDTSTKINRLIWLASQDSLDAGDVEGVLSHYSPKEVAKAVGIDSIGNVDWDNFDFKTGSPAEWFIEVMIGNDKLGFLAEIAVPKRINFDEHGGHSFGVTRYLDLVYAETREELAEKIVAASERWKEHDRNKEAEAKE